MMRYEKNIQYLLYSIFNGFFSNFDFVLYVDIIRRRKYLKVIHLEPPNSVYYRIGNVREITSAQNLCEKIGNLYVSNESRKRTILYYYTMNNHRTDYFKTTISDDI